ncbi:DUF6922 domain-containing protein [Deferrisoma palaeochoriense]
MSSIPKKFHPLFLDTDPARVDWDAHRDWVIRRFLAEGDHEAVRWVWRQLGDEGLRAWLRRTRCRGLSRRRIRFWQTVLDLPADEVEEWLADPARKVWDERGFGR